MKYYIKYAILSAILLLAASCSSNQVTDERLLAVEEIMDARPDSALQILQSIDYNAFDYERDKALYFIYLYQATDKLHIMQSTDSLITISCNYFDGTDENLRKLQSHYYCGKANFYGKNYVKAITETLEGELYVNKIEDPYWKAKIYELLADIYYNTYHPKTSNPYRKKCVEYYSQAGKFLNTMYATADLALCYFYIDCDSMLIILDECLKNNNIEDSICLGFFQDAYVRPLNKLERYEEAIYHFNLAQKYYGSYADEYIEYPSVALSYIRINELDSAKKYLDRHLAIFKDVSNDEFFHIIYSLYLSKTGNYKEAYEDHCLMMDIHNKKEEKSSKNEIGGVATEFHSLKSISEKQKAEYFRLLLYCIIIIFTIIILFICIAYKFRVKQKRQELENKILDLIELRDNLSFKEDQMTHLFNDRFNRLNQWCDEYFSKKESNQNSNSLVSGFEEFLELCREQEYFNLLEKDLNKFKNNILQDIREQLPSLSENDINLLILTYSGFSTRAICLILNLNIQNYYNRRKRLKAKIENSDAPDKIRFIEQFEKQRNR